MIEPYQGVPANATAIAGNLTVVGQTRAGYVSMTQTATNTPTTSTLNFPVGDIRANGVTGPLSGAGQRRARLQGVERRDPPDPGPHRLLPVGRVRPGRPLRGRPVRAVHSGTSATPTRYIGPGPPRAAEWHDRRPNERAHCPPPRRVLDRPGPSEPIERERVRVRAGVRRRRPDRALDEAGWTARRALPPRPAYALLLAAFGPPAAELLRVPLFAAAVLLPGALALVAGIASVAVTFAIVPAAALPLVGLGGAFDGPYIIASAVALRAIVVLAVQSRTVGPEQRGTARGSAGGPAGRAPGRVGPAEPGERRRGGRSGDRRGDAPDHRLPQRPGLPDRGRRRRADRVRGHGRCLRAGGLRAAPLPRRAGLHRLGRGTRRAAARRRRQPRSRAASRSRAPTTSTSRCSSCRWPTTGSRSG